MVRSAWLHAPPVPRRPGIVSACLVAVVFGVTLLEAARHSDDRPPQATAGARKSYKDWKMDDLLPSVADLGTGHDWNQGRELFKKAACGVCHAFGTESEGTGLAPDLTGIGATQTREFILQSILEPSATINGRFFHTKFTLRNGDVITGSVIDVANKKILIAPVMMNPQATVEIAEADVKSEEPSPESPMPPGLLNEFTKAEIVALMAFLDAGGDRAAAVYKKK